MGLIITVFLVELVVASAIYYFIHRLFLKKTFVALAITASLIGLIAGWAVGYRAIGADITLKYLQKANLQYQQSLGRSLSAEDEKMLKERLFAELDSKSYFLHKEAAVHALPSFLVVMVIMIRLSKKHEKQYVIGIEQLCKVKPDLNIDV